MKRRTWKRLLKWIQIVFLVYVLAGILFYSFQERLLFRAKSLPPDYHYQFQIPFREVSIPYNNTTKISIVQFTVPDSLCRGVVLYFHGNRTNINRYARYATNFTRNGYAVWMMDYPGYGKSTGERSEEVFYRDAMLLYKLANSRFGADSIVIYGKSLGTGPATWLASQRTSRQLILESPYYSLDAVARHFFPVYPVGALLHFHFPSYEFAANVTVPVTIFHGTSDWLIPYRNATRLQKAFPKPPALVAIKGGGHNNLNSYRLFHQKLDSLLQAP